MKSTKQLFALAVVGLAVGLSGVARASQPVTTYTYEFTATPGDPGFNTDFDGSMITIAGGTVLSYSFIDTALGSTIFTTNNTTFSEMGVTSGPTGWSGSVNVDLGGPASLLATGDSLDYFTAADPIGTWGIYQGVPSGVPDASSTFALLFGGVAALAGLSYWNRSRVAVQRSRPD